MFKPRLSRDRYINPLTDFGFKRLFGTEPNKNLLIDFLNVILPTQHRVKYLTYRSTENLGNTPLDRKAMLEMPRELGYRAGAEYAFCFIIICIKP